jgi:hypothetical protein
VTVFREIAARMPPKSLLHLLQGMHNTDDFCGKFPPEDSGDATESRVNFLENEDGGIHCTVYMIPRISDPTLWWQSDEMQAIRNGCGNLVDHYRQYQLDYVDAIRLLMESDCTSSQNTSKAMKCIMNKSICRGLESHIVAECRRNGKIHRKRVLEAQDEVYEFLDDDTDIGYDTIRQASCEKSHISTLLAYKLAQHDALQVLEQDNVWSDDISESRVDPNASFLEDISESFVQADDFSESEADCSILSLDLSESTVEVTSISENDEDSDRVTLPDDLTESMASFSSQEMSESTCNDSVWSDLSGSIF